MYTYLLYVSAARILSSRTEDDLHLVNEMFHARISSSLTVYHFHCKFSL